MNKVEIRSSGFKPSPKLRTHIINNLARLFRHEKEIERVLLYISKEVMGKTQKQYSLVGRVAVPGPDLVIENRGENLESVITDASHKMDRAIRRRSRKCQSKMRSGLPLDFVQ